LIGCKAVAFYEIAKSWRCETGETGGGLAEQINNGISKLSGFDVGTKCTLDTECVLVMGNIQLSGMVGLFRKNKKS